MTPGGITSGEGGQREMGVTGRLHGRPLQQLNQLVRWYTRTALGLLCLAVMPLIISPLLNHPVVLFGAFSLPLIIATLFLFIGAIGMKFLPGAMGGNPHVYSLKLGLYSYWCLTMGGLAASFSNSAILCPYAPDYLAWLISLFSCVLLLGGYFLLYNLWKTMEVRV